jgi:hypothetical protein
MITNAQLMEKLIEAKDNLKISELVVTLENKLPYKQHQRIFISLQKYS